MAEGRGPAAPAGRSGGDFGGGSGLAAKAAKRTVANSGASVFGLYSAKSAP